MGFIVGIPEFVLHLNPFILDERFLCLKYNK